MYFEYGETELTYLKQKDKRLGEVIDQLGRVSADTILDAGVERLQALGMTFKKAEYITDFAEKVKEGSFDIDGIWEMSDEEAIPGMRDCAPKSR